MDQRTIELSLLWGNVGAFRRPITALVVAAGVAAATVAFLLPPW